MLNFYFWYKGTNNFTNGKIICQKFYVFGQFLTFPPKILTFRHKKVPTIFTDGWDTTFKELSAGHAQISLLCGYSNFAKTVNFISP